ncbi:protein of unknown function [Amycolatopsis marina]|uniref:DnaJ homologue subfamily C member 28 conserved domain-containing protein n=1 Tax=Amycolatopsis marina TaxID=490629 RepID=A0A1I0YRV9_9PSEU|nr:DUF1992 domain-containing protein [Amycolatopsis marina]SFB15941.1 protein of unknown function [Amycolatopsis marina]
MTERKPPGVTFESWVDKQIREAGERGELDNLPGTGKPLPDLNKPHDEMWWIRQKMEREGLSAEALLPTPLRLRKEIERLPDAVRGLPTEQAVRDVVAELNEQIVRWLRAPSGPQVPLGPVNVDDVLRQWHADRAEAGEKKATTPEEPNQRTTWWHRFSGRRKESG